MMKNIIPILILPMMLLASCLLPAQDNSDGNDASTTSDNESQLTDISLISNIDEYVNEIRETIEETFISKQKEGNEETVVFVKDSDTVKISVMTDTTRTVSTDIYFQKSAPVFASRNVILDVDSSYLETAYFKDGELYKCFRNGTEINTALLADGFMRHITR
jgi:endonuclease YncB( thermonuclease family)